ncbi:MAG: hypothetical protein CMJ83_11210 [Planctomycetes bacterium]|nr:hypothetical protein [Planctomycetota bacterium]
MDVFNIGGANAPKAPDGGSIDKKSTAPRGDQVRSSSVDGPVGDSYATSRDALRVDTLLDRLIAGPNGEVNTELVEQFRALIQIGGLDTPENAQKAADTLLNGGL